MVSDDIDDRAVLNALAIYWHKVLCEWLEDVRKEDGAMPRGDSWLLFEAPRPATARWTPPN